MYKLSYTIISIYIECYVLVYCEIAAQIFLYPSGQVKPPAKIVLCVCVYVCVVHTTVVHELAMH